MGRCWGPMHSYMDASPISLIEDFGSLGEVSWAVPQNLVSGTQPESLKLLLLFLFLGETVSHVKKYILVDLI